jgi:uncharacterized protein YbaR (Trm112 family)
MDLLDILRCPEGGKSLRLAPSGLIQELEGRRTTGRLINRGGKRIDEPLTAGLVREDGLVFYPVRGGIPILLIDESIILDNETFLR